MIQNPGRVEDWFKSRQRKSQREINYWKILLPSDWRFRTLGASLPARYPKWNSSILVSSRNSQSRTREQPKFALPLSRTNKKVQEKGKAEFWAFPFLYWPFSFRRLFSTNKKSRLYAVLGKVLGRPSRRIRTKYSVQCTDPFTFECAIVGILEDNVHLLRHVYNMGRYICVHHIYTSMHIHHWMWAKTGMVMWNSRPAN